MLNIRVMTVAAVILLASAPALPDTAREPFWMDLQDGWSIVGESAGSVAVPAPGARSREMSFFEAMKLRGAGQPITIARSALRPRTGGDLIVFLKNTTGTELRLNGTLLAARQAAPGEALFEVPVALWGDSNALTISATGINQAPDENAVPALFLTNTEGLRRLRSGTVTIDTDTLRAGSPVTLSGPVFMMKLDDVQYQTFSRFPDKTVFYRDRFFTVAVPSPAEYLLKTLGHRRLMYEFFLDFTGDISVPLALHIEAVRGPDELYIDGVPVGKTGATGNRSRLYYDRTRLYPIPGTLVRPGAPVRVNLVTGASTDNLLGSIDGPVFRLGTVEGELRAYSMAEIIAVAIAAVYLIVGLYYGFLWMRRVSYWEYIFFSASCICLALYFFLRTQAKYLFFDDFFTLKRIEYIILFLLMPSMSLFMHFFFKPRSSMTEKLFRFLFYLYLPVGIASALIPVFLPDINTWNRVLVYVQLTWAVPMLYIVFLIIRESLYYLAKKVTSLLDPSRTDPLFGAIERYLAAVRTPWQRIAGALPDGASRIMKLGEVPFDRQVRDTDADGALMITAVFIMIAAAVHDILLDNNIITGSRLASYGTLMFVLGIAMILTGRIFRLYRRVGELNRGLNEAVSSSEKQAGNLREIIHGVEDASRDLVSISGQLSEIGDTFASMSEKEARGSAELSAIFHELTASTERISVSADLQADEGGKTTALVETFNETQKGATQMIDYVLGHIADITRSKNDTVRLFNDMIGKMRIINEGGAQINSFVEIINDITDKINLLSLNASIEAARAGEHGRGFAVVADEISKLATATSDNSKEISSQINIILSDIREGMNVADITKHSTDSIFNLLDEINSRIDSVESLIRRQSEAFANVIQQAGVIDRHAKEIAALTADQKTAMAQSTGTVEGLSTMASQISASSAGILTLTASINEKTRKLQALIQGID